MPNLRVLVPIGIAIGLWWLFAAQFGSPQDLNAPGAIVEAVRPRGSGSPCRPTAAELTATEIAAGPAEGTPIPAALTYPLITSELAVLAGDREIPRLFPSLIVRAPAESQSDLLALFGASIASLNPELKDRGPALEYQNALRGTLENVLANASEDPDDFGIFSSTTATASTIRSFRLGRLTADEARLEEVLTLSEPPLVSLREDGTITLIVPKGPHILADQPAQEAQSLLTDGERSPRGTAHVGGWEVSSDGRYLHFRIKGRPPAQTAWQVRICSDGLPIVSAAMSILPTPTPARTPTPSAPGTPADTEATPMAATVPSAPKLMQQNSNTVSWWVRAAEEPPDLEAHVVVQASPLMQFRNWLLAGIWQTVFTVLSYVLPMGLLLLGMWLISGRKDASPELNEARQRLIAAAWSTGRLSIAAVVSHILFFGPDQGFGPVPPNWVPIGIPLFVIISGGVFLLGFLDGPGNPIKTDKRIKDEVFLLIICFIVVGVCIYSLSQIRSTKIPSIIMPALLVAGYSMFLVTAGREWYRSSQALLQRPRPSTFSPWPIMALPTVGMLSLLLCFVQYWAGTLAAPGDLYLAVFAVAIIPFWVTWCAVVGIVLFAFALVPQEVAELVPGRVRDIARPTFRGIATVIILVAVLLQWTWAYYSQKTVWWRALVEADPGSHLNDIAREVLIESRVLPWYPFNLFRPLTEVFFFLGLIGILGILSAAARSGKLSIWGSEGKRFRAVLMILFAVFVIGYGGELFGFRTPVAFLLGLALLPFAWPNPDATDNQTLETNNDHDENRSQNTNTSGVQTSPAMDLRGTEETKSNLKPPVMERLLRAIIAKLQRFYRLASRTVGAIKAGPNRIFAQATAGAASNPELGNVIVTVSAAQSRPEGVEREVKPVAGDHDPQAHTAEAAGTESGVTPCPSREEVVRDLARGPRDDWWQNGILAAELGTQLAVLPIVYFIFIFVTSQGAVGWSWSTPFAVNGLISALIFEVAFWLVAALFFGCMFTHIFGPNGLIKGAALAAVYVAANAGAALFGIPGNALWQVRSFQLLLFLMLLGAWMDFKSLRDPRIRWTCLFNHYDIPFLTNVYSKLLPLITALAAVVVQLLLGQTHEATVNLVSGGAFEAFNAVVQSNLLR
jgi:hypothetical protein